MADLAYLSTFITVASAREPLKGLGFDCGKRVKPE